MCVGPYVVKARILCDRRDDDGQIRPHGFGESAHVEDEPDVLSGHKP